MIKLSLQFGNWNSTILSDYSTTLEDGSTILSDKSLISVNNSTVPSGYSTGVFIDFANSTHYSIYKEKNTTPTSNLFRNLADNSKFQSFNSVLLFWLSVSLAWIIHKIKFATNTRMNIAVFPTCREFFVLSKKTIKSPKAEFTRMLPLLADP